MATHFSQFARHTTVVHGWGYPAGPETELGCTGTSVILVEFAMAGPRRRKSRLHSDCGKGWTAGASQIRH